MPNDKSYGQNGVRTGAGLEEMNDVERAVHRTLARANGKVLMVSEIARNISGGGKLKADGLMVRNALRRLVRERYVRAHGQGRYSAKTANVVILKDHQAKGPTNMVDVGAFIVPGRSRKDHVPTPGTTAAKEKQLAEAIVKLGFTSGAALERETKLAHGFVQRRLLKLSAAPAGKSADFYLSVMRAP